MQINRFNLTAQRNGSVIITHDAQCITFLSMRAALDYITCVEWEAAKVIMAYRNPSQLVCNTQTATEARNAANPATARVSENTQRIDAA